MKDQKVSPNAVESTPANEVKLVGISISKENFAKSYRVLNGDSTAKVLVASVSAEMPLLDGNGDQVIGSNDNPLMKHIINLKAVPASKVKEIKALFEGRDSVDLGELAQFTLSYNAIVPESGNLNLPFKGQEIVAQTAMFASRKHEGTFTLGIASIAVPIVAKAASFSFDSILDEEEIEEEA
jgi:hypothetical protein